MAIRNTYWAEYKKLFLIAYPVALSQLGHIAVGVADTIMAGTLGGTALAAATIATSVYIPFLMLCLGLSFGVTTVVAQANGEGNEQKIVSYLRHSLILNIGIGVLSTVLLYFSPMIIPFLDQPKEVEAGAIPFLRITAFAMLPLMVFQAFKQFAEGLGVTKPSMFVSVSANLVNIGLIFVFKDGMFGIPAMGLNGIAWATFVARIYMMVSILVIILLDKRFVKYMRLAWKEKGDAKVYRALLVLSIPIGFQMVFESGAFGFAAIMVGWLGADQIAAHQIALNMAAVTYMIATGIAAAATVRVGYEYGKGNFVRSRLAGFAAMHLVVVYMVTMAVLFILFRNQLPYLYIAEEGIVAMTTGLLMIAAFFQLSDGLQVVGLGALRGMSDVKIPTSLVFFAYWGLGLPLGYLLAFSFGLGIYGVWWGLFAGLLLVAGFLVYRFHRKTIGLVR